MSVDLTSNVESQFFIGTSVAATDATSFAADTYVEVGGVIDLGEISDELTMNETKIIGEGRSRLRPGTRKAASQDLVCGYDRTDAGQIAMVAASAGNAAINFKALLGDGAKFYYRGYVTKVGTPLKTADDTVQRTFSIAPDSAIVEVGPA